MPGGGRITITNYTLRMLIHEAYGVQTFQISGGPKWTVMSDTAS